MSRAFDRLHTAATRAKFAREAFLDLPADASPERRAVARTAAQRAEQAHAVAMADLLRERGRVPA